MAKRKRLELPTDTVSPDLETKSAFPAPRAKMPIADVAGEVAGRAALEEVAREMTAAEGEGRIVKKLPLIKNKSSVQDNRKVEDSYPRPIRRKTRKLINIRLNSTSDIV